MGKIQSFIHMGIIEEGSPFQMAVEDVGLVHIGVVSVATGISGIWFCETKVDLETYGGIIAGEGRYTEVDVVVRNHLTNKQKKTKGLVQITKQFSGDKDSIRIAFVDSATGTRFCEVIVDMETYGRILCEGNIEVDVVIRDIPKKGNHEN